MAHDMSYENRRENEQFPAGTVVTIEKLIGDKECSVSSYEEGDIAISISLTGYDKVYFCELLDELSEFELSMLKNEKYNKSWEVRVNRIGFMKITHTVAEEHYIKGDKNE